MQKGLDDAAVSQLRAQYGFNELPTEKESLILLYLKNFWGPLAWLMELLIGISFFSGQNIEGFVIAFLLIVNSLISIMQHRSASAALAVLSKNLSTVARVFRNGIWQSIATRELLPGDMVHVKTGDIVPADITITEGNISVDMANLTGESLPKEVSVNDTIFSGCIVKRGEVNGTVIAIGAATAYGKTTTLLETSHPPTHMEKIIFTIIKYFFIINIVLSVIVIIFGVLVHAPTTQIVNFVLVLLLTSVPISFPTVFAVSQSYGALALSKAENGGVLVRRLAAVQECATVDVFCSDKTGTLTENQLTVGTPMPYGKYSEADVIRFAAACSDAENGGSIDSAIFTKATTEKVAIPEHHNFIGFDFLTKCTEVDITTKEGVIHIRMGLPESLLQDDVMFHDAAHSDVARLSAQGLRVMALVASDGNSQACIGLITLSDPIKADAPEIIKELNALGVRVVMITGDGLATARAVAAQLGLAGEVITASELQAHPEKALQGGVFAEAYPQDKLTIIRALQQAGHTVGMTGDGVNDAAALRQAEVGIAVCGATDVAKQSASFILTNPGLDGVVHAIKISREVYGRLRIWTTNKTIKSIEVAFFTTILFFFTHAYILSPLLAVLLVFANDFVTISIATDRMKYSQHPGSWNVRNFITGATIIACVPVILLLITYHVAVSDGYAIAVTRTVIYLALILYGQANLYAIRAWPQAWSTRPSLTLVLATLFSLAFACTISIFGFFIAPIRLPIVLFIVILTAINFFAADLVKSIPLVRKLIGV